MKKTMDKNYYELLGVSADSTAEEIEQAYKSARELYSGGSDALYSLYSPQEITSLTGELARAYETLRDPGKKLRYDEELVAAAEEDAGPSEVDLGYILGGLKERPAASTVIATSRTATLKQRLMVEDGLNPAFAEQYRILYTKLAHMQQRDRFKVFSITSSVNGEGKTMTSVHLAFLMAKELNKRVALIEGDMRHPTFENYFSWNGNSKGLNEVLQGKAVIGEALLRLQDTPLYVLPAGSRTEAPEALIKIEMKKLLDALKQSFDFVIVDCPPILPLADVSMLSKIVDGLLLVIKAGSTPRDVVLQAVKNVSEASILGIVLNSTETPKKEHQYYGA